MAQRVMVKGVGPVDFPDDMSREDIAAAIDRNLPRVAPQVLRDPKVKAAWAERTTRREMGDTGKGLVRSTAEAFLQEGGRAMGKIVEGVARASTYAPPAVPGMAGVRVPHSAMGELLREAERQAAETPLQREIRAQQHPLTLAGQQLQAGAEAAYEPNPFYDDTLTQTLGRQAGGTFPAVAAGVLGGPMALGAAYGAQAGQEAAQEALDAFDAEAAQL